VAVGWGLTDLLEYLHMNGVARVDIKPSNIVVQEDGRPVLVDLGIARAVDSGSRLTMTGVVIGTPRYAAPEQLFGAPIDIRADLYSLGLILYEIISGRPVRTGTDVATMLREAADERVRVDLLQCSPELRLALGALLVADRASRCPHPKEAARLLTSTPEARAR
jgi:serine/threonine protein kinase